jgi:hypothetical protein
MQQTIRRTPQTDFSSLNRFVELHENEELRRPIDVAGKIATIIQSSSNDEIVISC